MKSNYSLFQNLPEFNSNRKENFSYKVGDVIYNNLYDLILNLDFLVKTKIKLQKQSDFMTKSMNEETDYNIKNQYEKNISVLNKSLFKTNYNLNLFKHELMLIDKKELFDLLHQLPNKKKIHILNILEKGI